MGSTSQWVDSTDVLTYIRWSGPLRSLYNAPVITAEPLRPMADRANGSDKMLSARARRLRTAVSDSTVLRRRALDRATRRSR